MKLNSTGTEAVYATYLGGVNAAAGAVTVDASGEAIVAGAGDSTFPVSPRTYKGVDKGQVFVAGISDSEGCSLTVEAITALSAGVTAPPGCNWIAVPGVPWISVTSGQSGSGNGTVQLFAAQNVGAARSGIVSIAGHQFTVNQLNACTLSLSAMSASFPANGGSGQFSGFIATGCLSSRRHQFGKLDSYQFRAGNFAVPVHRRQQQHHSTARRLDNGGKPDLRGERGGITANRTGHFQRKRGRR